jgi:hypothetical protein
MWVMFDGEIPNSSAKFPGRSPAANRARISNIWASVNFA